MRPRALQLVLVPALLASACTSESDSDRTSEIVAVLTQADRGLIDDRAAAVQLKYEKMGEHAYNFVRGSLPLYLSDLEEQEELIFGLLPSGIVLSNADPHPENLGTFGNTSGVLADWNDYDASGHVPATQDLIRAGYAFVVFIEETTQADPGPALDAFLSGYHQGEPGDGGLFVAKLVERALEKGAERDELDDVVAGPAGPIFERDGEELVDADAAFAAELQQAVPAYAPTRNPGAPALGAVRDVVRQMGKGVTSHPLERYLVLVAGGQPDGSEDRVLEVKEAWDPSLDEHLEVVGSKPFVAHRIVGNSREAGAGPALDLDLGVLVAAEKGYVVKGASGYSQDLDYDRVLEKFAEGDYTSDDLPALGRFLGGTLAISHRRGGAATTRITETKFARETILSFARRAQDDHELFQERLAEGAIVVPK